MSANEYTSLSLLERLRDPADSDAWRSFHDLYGPWIRHWLVRKGLQEQDADDVFQEVFRVAATELGQFEHSGRPGALRRWLREVLANRLRTFWRQKCSRPGAVGGSEHLAMAEELQDPASQLSRAWDEEYRRAVCDRLFVAIEHEFEGKTMAAFRSVALEGKRPADVAAELQMTPNAVRIAQSRVLRRMRELGEGILDSL
jgi:RNA polymerase sigma-70 factor, ECF subfamily